ncbi:MAG: nucleotide pyrophosphohydrolase [Candidatus Lokiarchaeota archaeon]|nr:nucleotide pyrophosphohydrolase [Candidatus Lokiarchaeota archaeon]
MWLVEEIGELATILNSKDIDKKKVSEEIADISAWINSNANLLEIDRGSILFNKNPYKCVRCNSKPCQSNTSRREKTVF